MNYLNNIMYVLYTQYKGNDCGMIKIIFITALVISTDLNTTITIMKRSRVKPQYSVYETTKPPM